MHPIETQLSATALSPSAESGDIARAIGFLPDRLHQAPARRVIDRRSVLFVWPEPSRHHPLPRRPGAAA
jgi:hypothetical protein